MKKIIFFSAMLMTLGLFSCSGKEKDNSTTSEKNSEQNKPTAQETTPLGSIEVDRTCANYNVRFEYEGLHYGIINQNSVYVAEHDAHRSITGDLVIPSKVRYNDATYYVVGIAGHAFEDNPYIASVVIPKSVKVMYEAAFANCCNLSTVTLPEGLIHLDRDIFYGSNLHSITLPDGIDFIGPNAFDNTPFYNNEANWENGVLYIGKYLLTAKKYISNCSIKEGTKYIADHAFYECSALTSVTIPNSVKSIRDYAFYGCSRLTSITIPNSVTRIGEWAFWDCWSLTSVSVPSHTEIAENAFPEHTEVIRY